MWTVKRCGLITGALVALFGVLLVGSNSTEDPHSAMAEAKATSEARIESAAAKRAAKNPTVVRLKDDAKAASEANDKATAEAKAADEAAADAAVKAEEAVDAYASAVARTKAAVKAKEAAEAETESARDAQAAAEAKAISASEAEHEAAVKAKEASYAEVDAKAEAAAKDQAFVDAEAEARARAKAAIERNIEEEAQRVLGETCALKDHLEECIASPFNYGVCIPDNVPYVSHWDCDE